MLKWKQAEIDFKESFDRYGKDAYVHRFTDTATAKATSGAGAFVAAQPSDFLVTLSGSSFYAEVKSTIDPTTFHYSNVRKGQWAAARMITRAGGLYFFFLKSEHLGQWYCVPAAVLINHTKKSIEWTELEPYKHDL